MLASPRRSSPRLADKDPNKENSVAAAAKKVRKRRKSVGPQKAAASEEDEEGDRDALRFELDNVLQDNEQLMEQIVEVKQALAASEADRARLQLELDSLKGITTHTSPVVDSCTALGLTDLVRGVGLMDPEVAGGVTPTGARTPPQFASPSADGSYFTASSVASSPEDATVPEVATVTEEPAQASPPLSSESDAEAPAEAPPTPSPAPMEVEVEQPEAEPAEAEDALEPSAPPPPPPADTEAPAASSTPSAPEEEKSGAGRRRSRRKSVVSKECLADAGEKARASLADVNEADAPAPADLPPPTQDTQDPQGEGDTSEAPEAAEPAASAADISIDLNVTPPTESDDAVSCAPSLASAAPEAAPAQSAAVNTAPAWPELEPGLLPSDEAIAEIADESALLGMAIQAAIASAGGSEGAEPVWAGVREVLLKLGGVACLLRGRPLGGKQKRTVRFAVHDLSCLTPPNVHRPGSETQQEKLIEQLVPLMHEQRTVMPPSALPTAAEAAVIDETPRSCLTHVLAAFASLASHASLSVDMRASATFYANELDHWLRSYGRDPMLTRRLSELLSSSIRMHLTAIFSEEEEAAEPDPTLAAILTRVREHAAAFGFAVATGEDAAEHFAALVSTNMFTLHQHAHLVSAGTPAHAALTALTAAGASASEGEASTALHELSAEEKASLLAWAQAHSTLMQVFGPREPLQKLMRAPVNKKHFERLGELAGHVYDLELRDEAYLGPLRDLHALQKRLHTEAGLAKAAHEGLLIFSMGSKRRSERPGSRRRKGK